MGRPKNSLSGTTKQPTKKAKEKPPRLTPEEKEAKYGVTHKKLNNPTLDYKLNFKAKNEKQKEYFKLIKEKQITVCTGEAGCGKSFVCLSAALDLLREDNEYKRILIITPTVEAGNMSIGFLPGSKMEKIKEYLDADFYNISKALYLSGNDGDEYLKRLLEDKYLVGDNVSFMRGKTIDNSIVIITEAENFNKQELFLLLSRISDSSKYIINGDNKQMDRKDIKKNELNGLEYAEKVLKDNLDEVGFCHFGKEDIVRSKLISKIMDLWFVE
jgi:phosphate starvation-inducible PhoH-like protein